MAKLPMLDYYKEQGIAFTLRQQAHICWQYNDLSIGVAFLCGDGTFAFSDSTIPFDLERYRTEKEDWGNGSMDTLLACARDIYCSKGYLSMLFEVLEKYRQSNGK